MLIRFHCGHVRHDVPDAPVCATTWEDHVFVADWISGDASSFCPSCYLRSYVQSDGTEVVDYGMPLAVVLCGVNTDGSVLAISRRNDHTAFGLPGGKVDPEDGLIDPENRLSTLRRALVREVREEIGVDLQDADLQLSFQLPDPCNYWNFCFVVDGAALASATTQEGEGIVSWEPWETLERGPFSSYNTALREHLNL